MAMTRLTSLAIVALVTGLAAAATAATDADRPSIRLRYEVDPREIRIGDRLRYEITTRFPSNVKPVPLDPATDFGPFELVDFATGEIRRRTETENEQRHTLYLTTFSTGTVSISSFTVSFETADGSRIDAPIEAVDIQVISLLEKHGDEGGLRPVKGFFTFRSYAWLWAVVGILAMGALAWAVVRFVRTRRGDAGGAGVPPRPPEEAIWDLLHELEKSDLIEQGRIKEYYSRLSTGLRQYIEGRYGFPALDRTTSEILGEIRARNLDSSLRARLKRVLESSDLVKFARFTPGDEEIDADVELIKRIVTETTPKPEPDPEKPEAAPL